MKKLLLVPILGFFMLTSCATIVSGSKQKVQITSTPSQATVYINEVEVGKTPYVTKLKRKQSYDVSLQLEGYKTYDTKIVKGFNGWYVCNIMFGGLIGVIVDPITGAMYRLSPNKLSAQLESAEALITKKDEVAAVSPSE